jgi:hypothetical protein
VVVGLDAGDDREGMRQQQDMPRSSSQTRRAGSPPSTSSAVTQLAGTLHAD